MKINAVNNFNYATDNVTSVADSVKINTSKVQSNMADTVIFTGNMDPAKKKRLWAANGIIHSASAGAALAAATMAQTPGGDTAALTAITAGMALGLCRTYNVSGTSSLGASIIAVSVGKQFGVGLATKLVAWIPGFGNAANAVSTALLHEATGWSIVALLEGQRKRGAIDQNIKITKETLAKYAQEGKNLKKDMKADGGGDATSFKGTGGGEQKLKLANKTIKQLIDKYDIANGSLEDENLSKNLKDSLCSIYSIDKDSLTANNVENILEMSNASVREVCKKVDKDTKEHIFDVSMYAPYMTIASYLQENLEQGKNLNNLKITPKNLQNAEARAIDIIKNAA